MSESDWLSGDIYSQIDVMARIAGKRRLRHFAVACCRQILPILEDERCRNAVEVAQRLADGMVTENERNKARKAALLACRDHPYPSREHADEKSAVYRACAVVLNSRAGDAARNVSDWILVHYQWWSQHQLSEQQAIHSDFLQDVCGNILYPITVDINWKGTTCEYLARSIYEEQCFDDLPVLADALEERGCFDEKILLHCREERRHVRGCWVVDMVLGNA